jgi:hypothetical protein
MFPDLVRASLGGSDLTDANLFRASQAETGNAILCHTIMPDGSTNNRDCPFLCATDADCRKKYPNRDVVCRADFLVCPALEKCCVYRKPARTPRDALAAPGTK